MSLIISKFNTFQFTLAIVLGCLTIFDVAVAANTSVLEEILVTAQKKEENAQDVGIAITSFTGKQLKDLGLTESVELARVSPNVAVSGSYGGQMSQFTIRGVTQNDFNDHVESVISVYIDDAYVTMQQGQTFSMFDINRVELLKGPQGTLFGRNATGGLVHFLTNQPTKDVSGYFDLTLGNFDHTRIEAALSGPITHGVRARVSGFINKHNGWIKNEYPQRTYIPTDLQYGSERLSIDGAGSDLGGIESEWGARANIDFDMLSTTKVSLSLFSAKTVASSSPYQSTPVLAILNADGNHTNTIHALPTETCETFQVGTGCVNGAFDFDLNTLRERPGADWYGFLDPDGTGLRTSSDWVFKDQNTNATHGGTLKVESFLSDISFTSVTGFKSFDKHFLLDVDGGPVNAFFWIGDAKTRSLSQELRFNYQSENVDWVAGTYFLDIENESVHGFGQLPDSPGPFVGWDQPRLAGMDTKSFAIFGQTDFQLGENLRLIAGLRWTQDSKDFDLEVLFVNPTFGLDPLQWDFSPTVESSELSRELYQNTKTENLFNWKLQLDWQPRNDALIYFGLTQGIKAGGFNAGGPDLRNSDIPYDEEVLLSYELGAKYDFQNGNARLNAALFYYDYEDYQASRWTGFSNLITNNNAKIYGAEFEIRGLMFSNFEGILSIGYQDNTVYDVQIAGAKTNVETAFAPKVTASALVIYSFPKNVFGGNLYFQADASFQSKVWQNLNNFDANQYDGYGILNTRVSWKSNDKKTILGLFVSNLLDKRYETVGFDLSNTCGCNNYALGKPRWIGINARYDF